MKAIELYALAWHQPFNTHARWLEDVAGQHIAAVTASLPTEVAEAAQTRGRELDLWETAKELPAELTELGWESSPNEA